MLFMIEGFASNVQSQVHSNCGGGLKARHHFVTLYMVFTNNLKMQGPSTINNFTYSWLLEMCCITLIL